MLYVLVYLTVVVHVTVCTFTIIVRPGQNSGC